MIIGILYNKSYEDILVNVKQEICDYFDPSVVAVGGTVDRISGLQTTESFMGRKLKYFTTPGFYKRFMGRETDIKVSDDDVFEVYIKGPEDENAEYNEIWPGHYTTIIFSKKKVGRLPNDNEMIEFLEFLDSDESIYVRRRVVVEGADIRDADDPGVEHVIWS